MQIQTCYFINYYLGVPAGDLSPTIPVEQSFEAYSRGEDSVMNAIEKQINISLD